MLTSNERILVEAIRNSKVLEITIPGDDGRMGDTYITIRNKKACHDVALAVQSYFGSNK